MIFWSFNVFGGKSLSVSKPINSTSSVPYRMLMTLIFGHFGVSMEDEPKDDEMLSWGAKKVVALRLKP